MAIADYATLRSAIQSWAARSDSVFSGQIETFIELAEDRLYNGAGQMGDPVYSPPLRSKAMEVSGTIALTAGVGTIPDTALELRKIAVADQETGLEFLPPERFALYAENANGTVPSFYTITGSTITVAPAASVTLETDYWRRYTTISSSNTTGELLSAHGMIYLEACLYEAFAFMQEVDIALAHLNRARGMIEGANRTARTLGRSGPLRIRQRVAMP